MEKNYDVDTLENNGSNLLTVRFESILISKNIILKLKKLGYKKMTKIQKICIPPALEGYDVLGSSKPGSGKTLCFVIPILEKIFLHKWNNYDSVFSCILCPVRELGVQIYDFLENFSCLNLLKIGLFLGGSPIEENRNRRIGFALIIATPGRLFQVHMNTKIFDFNNLKILVLDEVDRILDMGFKKIFSLFLECFPKKKQTLLFSATLSKNLKNLARLNLLKPYFGCVKTCPQNNIETSKKNFPGISQKISQYYAITSPGKKNDILFSFLKSHNQKKIIVFFSTRKKVKFFYFVFRKLKLNSNFFYTFGDMNQTKRVNNFFGFCKAKRGVLFTTDVLSRGIDFKLIDWVIQMDCPQNIETYLHRVGRTGRLSKNGLSLLFLNHFEIGFLKDLLKQNINISLIHFNRKQILNVKEMIKQITRKNKNFFNLAQNAFFNYIRFIFFQKNKRIFDLKRIIWKETAEEFGLGKLLITKG